MIFISDLVVQNNQLPANLEDLSKFILVGREKLVSVRAEIRAIDKLNLAQEVRDQKKEEALMLSEALLDAEVKLGELLKQIPKAQGIRTDKNEIQLLSTSEQKLSKNRPKAEIIKDLGFNQNQVHRFETLADNKDLVEQVKAEARENDDIPTRSRVLDLAQQRKKREAEVIQKNNDYYKYLDFCTKTAKKFSQVLYEINNLDVDEAHLKAWAEHLDSPVFLKGEQEKANEALSKLIKIQRFLKELKT